MKSFTVITIFGVVLLVFAGIGFPAEIKVINELNKHIVFWRGNMSFMGIESFVGLSLE